MNVNLTTRYRKPGPTVAAVLAVLVLAALLPPMARAETAPPWPAVAQQLERDHVIPGSALERLIRANQDFAMLRKEEASDTIVVPLWLRVFWRKAHPEAKFSAEDPTGGYPLVLKEIWEWMVTHQELRPGPPDVPDVSVRAASVGTDLRISGAQTTPRSESAVRICPTAPTYVIGASNNIQGSGQQAQFYSSDGGATWNQTSLGLQTGDALHSDPTVEWTSDGTAWATTIGIDSSLTTLKLRAYKSVDHGATWTFDGTFSGTQTDTDKQMTWVDSSLISSYRDTIYAIWHNGSPVYMNRRTSSGWQTPVKVSGSETTGTGIGGDVRTNSAGEVFGFWPDTGSRKVLMVKSTDGGATYGTPVTIATTYDSYDIGVPAMNSRRVLIYVTAGAYRTAAKSYVFAAWNDLTGASGCTTASNEPGSSVSSSCKTRIWFTRSTDGGSTWTTPTMINNATSKNDQFNPWLTVDESTGRVAVMYYDTVADTNRVKTDVYYQSSADFGATWSSAIKVTTAQTDETTTGTNFGNQYGDYNGLSGFAGAFLPSWTDRRNAKKEEIWTAPVTDSGGTGPDPSIRPWGVDRVPPAPPWWQTSDIWVDNDGDGVLNETGEPSRGKTDNQLSARVTNVGSTAASAYRVTFKFKPYTTNASAPATLIGSVDETGFLAVGASRSYTVSWDLSDTFIQSHFTSTFWTADHFCVQVTIGASGTTLDDVNPVNNFAQSNFDNVPVAKGQAKVLFFLYNHLDRPAVASIEASVRDERWRVRFEGVRDPGRVLMEPKQWLAVVASVAGPAVEGGLTSEQPVLVDVVQKLDGARVGGLTMALVPPPVVVSRKVWRFGPVTGGSWPLPKMSDDYDAGFMFGLQLERAISATMWIGLQAGYHDFDADNTAVTRDNLGVSNLSLTWRQVAAGGHLRPFLLGGVGAYRLGSTWKAGIQAGGGLEVPVTSDIRLTTGLAAHLTGTSRDVRRSRWVDGYLGFLVKVP